MQNNFEACLAITDGWEGGYVDHPADPGGKTYRGVTQGTYDMWRRRWGQRTRDVRQLTRAERIEIYRQGYWQPCGGDDLSAGLDLVTFDAGVNSGPSRGVKWLQKAVGAIVDGIFGPDTKRRAGSTDKVPAIHKVCDLRLSFMRSLNIWATFGKGWSRRVADVRAKGVVMHMQSRNVPADRQREELEADRDRSTDLAKRQGQGAGGAAGGGGLTVGTDQLQPGWFEPWMLYALIGAAVLIGGLLIIRALINRDRANAMARAAGAIK